jgi:hypothetical protein
MKALGLFATVFLFTNLLPAFAYPSQYKQMSWDTTHFKMSDVRFNPDFMTLSVSAANTKGKNFNLVVQCGNNPNAYYKEIALSGKVAKFDQDKELVTMLCNQALEIRDAHILQILSTANCKQINLQYGIRSIPVAYYGELAKKKDRNRNGYACDLEP